MDSRHSSVALSRHSSYVSLSHYSNLADNATEREDSTRENSISELSTPHAISPHDYRAIQLSDDGGLDLLGSHIVLASRIKHYMVSSDKFVSKLDVIKELKAHVSQVSDKFRTAGRGEVFDYGEEVQTISKVLAKLSDWSVLTKEESAGIGEITQELNGIKESLQIEDYARRLQLERDLEEWEIVQN